LLGQTLLGQTLLGQTLLGQTLLGQTLLGQTFVSARRGLTNNQLPLSLCIFSFFVGVKSDCICWP
jgi:hypothetical protein